MGCFFFFFVFLKLDPSIFESLQKERVEAGDVIYIEANSGAVKVRSWFVCQGEFETLRRLLSLSKHPECPWVGMGCFGGLVSGACRGKVAHGPPVLNKVGSLFIFVFNLVVNTDKLVRKILKPVEMGSLGMRKENNCSHFPMEMGSIFNLPFISLVFSS